MVIALMMVFAIVNLGTLEQTALQVLRSYGFLSIIGLGLFSNKIVEK